MKNLAIKITVKIALAIVLCAILSIVVSSFAPHLSNDLAIGQLENDDMSWTMMEVWHQVQNYTGWGYTIISIICGCSIGKDIYAFIKNRKENN